MKKRYYLYNEDMSGYIINNDLPYSDESQFISGFLDQEFEDELYFDDKIKKAYKGQYYQNEIVVDIENPSDLTNWDCLENGYYKITLKADDDNNNLINNWWTYTSQSINTGENNIWESNSSRVIFQLDKKFGHHRWYYKDNIDPLKDESGRYRIYDQNIIFYRQKSPLQNWVYYNINKKKFYIYDEQSNSWNLPDLQEQIYRGNYTNDEDPNLYDAKENWTYFNTISGTLRKYNNGWKNIPGTTTGYVFKGSLRKETDSPISLIEEPIGVVELQFLNSENLDSYRKLVIKCKQNEKFYGNTYISQNWYEKEIIDEKDNYLQIPYSGVAVDPQNQFYYDYLLVSGLLDQGQFVRKYYKWQEDSSPTFIGYRPNGAGGYYEKYVPLKEGSYNINFSTGSLTFVTNNGRILLTSGKKDGSSLAKKRYLYQYGETLNNYNDEIGNSVIQNVLVPNNGTVIDESLGSTNTRSQRKSPIQSVGVTTDIFGFHKYISPSSGYVRIEFLGPDTLSTVNAKILGGMPSNIALLQDTNINIPRNNKITYDFIYSEDLIQIDRGKLLETPQEIFVYKNEDDGSIFEKPKETPDEEHLDATISNDPNKVYVYSHTYSITADKNFSYVEKRKKGNLIGVVPLYEIAVFKRNSDYSESFDFTLKLEDYAFSFKSERKKFRVYFDESRLVKNDIDGLLENSIERITVNDNDITSDDRNQRFYEVPYLSTSKELEDFGLDGVEPGNWARIKITYNKNLWGLTRDFTSFTSRLVKLLNEKGSYWRYDPGSRSDEILVRMNRDINLDLSHQGQLFLLYIAYIKENNTLDKDFELNPMRLKLGRVPYTVQDTDRGGLSATYVTEGETMWLDWGFESSDPDFEKKIFVNEVLSSLPPEYTMFHINEWNYNQDWDSREPRGDLDESLSNNSHKYLQGLDFDFYRVTERHLKINELGYAVLDNTKITRDNNDPKRRHTSGTTDNFYREKPFQSMMFRMPPQTFTIKLVVSFQHGKFTLHKDDLGILDPELSSEDFIPGDIIRLQFKIDNKHFLSDVLPTPVADGTLSDYFSYNDSLDDSSYDTFIQKLLNLYKHKKEYLEDYSNINETFDQMISKRTPLNEELFTFYILEKSHKNINKLLHHDKNLLITWDISKQRKSFLEFCLELCKDYMPTEDKLLGYSVKEDYIVSTSIKENKYFEKRQLIPTEELISIYFVMQNKDMDLWISPKLIPHQELYSIEPGQTFYYRVEQSGYYSVYMSGSKCGNGGNGGVGLSAGTKRGNNTADVYPAVYVSAAGFPDGAPYGADNIEPQGLHSHPFEGMTPNANLHLWGRRGGNGGPGWIGGNGGNGGQGTGLGMCFYKVNLTIKLGVWHFKATIKIPIPLPSIVIAGGKEAGEPGGGGKGFNLPGFAGVPGVGTTLLGTGTGNSGPPGILGNYPLFDNDSLMYNKDSNVRRRSSVFSRRNDLVYIRKNTLLFNYAGLDGNDGIEGNMIYNESPDNTIYKIFNLKRHDLNRQGPDGGGGSPGLPTIFCSLNNLIGYKEGSIDNIYGFLVKGLDVSFLFQPIVNDSSAWGAFAYTWLKNGVTDFLSSVGLGVFFEMNDDNYDFHIGILKIGVENNIITLMIEYKILVFYQCVFYQRRGIESDNAEESLYYNPSYVAGGNYKKLEYGISGQGVTEKEIFFSPQTIFASPRISFFENEKEGQRENDYIPEDIGDKELMRIYNDDFLIKESPRLPQDFNIFQPLSVSIPGFFDGIRDDISSNFEEKFYLSYLGLQLGIADSGIKLYFREGIDINDTFNKKDFNYYLNDLETTK